MQWHVVYSDRRNKRKGCGRFALSDTPEGALAAIPAGYMLRTIGREPEHVKDGLRWRLSAHETIEIFFSQTIGGFHDCS